MSEFNTDMASDFSLLIKNKYIDHDSGEKPVYGRIPPPQPKKW